MPTTTSVGTVIKSDDLIILNAPSHGWRVHRVTFAGKTTVRSYDIELPHETFTLTPEGKPKGASYAESRFVSPASIQKWADELGLPWGTTSEMMKLCSARNREKAARDAAAHREREAREAAKRAAWAEEHKALARAILPADWQSYFEKGLTLDRWLLTQPIPINAPCKWNQVAQGFLCVMIPHPQIAAPEAHWWQEWRRLEARCSFIGILVNDSGQATPKDYSHNVNAEINPGETDDLLIVIGAMLAHLH